MNFSLSKRSRKKWRWIRPPLQPLSLVLVNKLRIWTQPLLRDLSHPLTRMRLCRWTRVVPLFHHISEMTILCMTLTRDISQINIQVSLRNLLGWSRPDPKNMQIKDNTRLGPGNYLSHHLQRKISPLYPCKGLPSPLGHLLIKTNLNTIQTHFFIGK